MSFEKDKAFGEIGESLAWNILINAESVSQVVDVRHDKSFQDEDVDFLVQRKDKSFTRVEVKTDSRAFSTGNVAYEVTTSGHVGCFAKTKANVVMYYVCDKDSLKGTMYQISVKAIRNYINSHELKLVDMGYASTGYLIPIEELKHNKVILGEWKYGR